MSALTREEKNARRRAKWPEHRDYELAARRNARKEHRDEESAKVRAYRLAHLEHIRATEKARRDRNRPRIMLLRASGKLGCTADWLEHMLIDSCGRCECCGRRFEKRIDEPHFDHDHSDGSIRGVLCRNCNVALGQIKESPLIAAKLAAYLAINAVEAA
jgi:hypothetical protein